MSKEELKGDYMRRTHKGLMYGLVPVYLDLTDAERPEVEGRFAGCEAMLDVVEVFFGMFTFLMTCIYPYYEPVFPIKITGKVDQ